MLSVFSIILLCQKTNLSSGKVFEVKVNSFHKILYHKHQVSCSTSNYFVYKIELLNFEIQAGLVPSGLRMYIFRPERTNFSNLSLRYRFRD